MRIYIYIRALSVPTYFAVWMSLPLTCIYSYLLLPYLIRRLRLLIIKRNLREKQVFI